MMSLWRAVCKVNQRNEHDNVARSEHYVRPVADTSPYSAEAIEMFGVDTFQHNEQSRVPESPATELEYVYGDIPQEQNAERDSVRFESYIKSIPDSAYTAPVVSYEWWLKFGKPDHWDDIKNIPV